MPASSSQAAGLPVRVITPQSGLHAFRIAGRKLITGISSAGNLAWRLFVRDTSAEHRQSMLGYVWLILPVVANTLTWVFLNSQGVVKIDSGSVPYPVFVLSGVALWTVFNGAVMAMLGVVPKARGVLSKVSFPHEALVYSAMLQSLLDALIASIILVPTLIAFEVGWSSSMLLYPVALAACLALGWAIGLILVPIAALYGDVSRAIQLALRFGFFLTPVIFPTPASGIARSVMLLNPVTPLVASGRAWLTGSGEAMPGAFAIAAVGAILIFFAGLLVFKVALPYIIERIAG
jgi:lipopolysaccharide transport system permease protein